MFSGGISVDRVSGGLNSMRPGFGAIPAGFTSDTALSLKNHEESSGSVSVVFDLPSNTGSVLLGRILGHRVFGLLAGAAFRWFGGWNVFDWGFVAAVGHGRGLLKRR
jgi:hypothetical protein